MITITSVAAEHLNEIMQEEHGAIGLRVFVQGGGCSGFQYGMELMHGTPEETDTQYESENIKLFVDPISLSYLRGATIDYESSLVGGAFRVVNPNASSTCGCGSSFSA